MEDNNNNNNNDNNNNNNNSNDNDNTYPSAAILLFEMSTFLHCRLKTTWLDVKKIWKTEIMVLKKEVNLNFSVKFL